MNIEKFTVSRDPIRYAGWPDVTLTANGKLVCVFSECTHHCVRSNTQIMLIDSADGGRTWAGFLPPGPLWFPPSQCRV